MQAMAAHAKRPRRPRSRDTLPAPRPFVEPMGLHLYAAVCLELAETPHQREEVFALFKTSEAEFLAADVHWRAQFAVDASLLRDYRRLYELQRTQLRTHRRR